MRRFVPSSPDFTSAPIMSLVSVLIPVLLMSASFVELGVIESNLPGFCGCGGIVEEKQPPPLNLQVYVHEWGLEVSGEDEELFGRVAIQGEDELEELDALLDDLKSRHPHEGRVVIVPDSRVRYDRLITVMDVSRGSGGDRFPWPVIAGGVE